MGFYGIDISTYQSGLDIGAVRDAGNHFVGVKSVASYLPQLTIAEDYHGNMDRVIAAGLPPYNYAVPNNQNTPVATAKFQWDIRYRYEPHHMFMLDNEPLNKYAVFWRDADAAMYFNALAAFGVPYTQMIFYCPAALTRANGPWPQMLALREKGLKIQWVSYGDMDPYYEDGEEPFVGNTGFDDPEMHQFTSSYTIPGYSGLIDRVFCRLDSVHELFGGGGTAVPRTFDGVIAWARNEAIQGNKRTNWGGWCELFINNGGAFNQAFNSALIAGSFSGPLRTDYGNAGRGAIIYWGGVIIDGEALGHDAFVYEPGPDPLLLMASNAVTDNWGRGIGTIRLSEYQRKFGHPLRGWTYRHGTETLNLSGTAGGGTTPIDDEAAKKQKELAMGTPNYHWGPDGDWKRGGVLLTDVQGPLFPTSAEEANLWKAEYASPMGCDLAAREWDVLVQSCRDRKAAYDAQVALASPAVDFDEAKLVEGLAPLVINAVLNALPRDTITVEQVKAAQEQVLRQVLGSLRPEA